MTAFLSLTSALHSHASHPKSKLTFSQASSERICITGGASQNLACVLQVFSDPLRTRVWMVAPCYFLACRIFGDAGLKVNAIGEGDEGVDLVALEQGLEEAEKGERGEGKVC